MLKRLFWSKVIGSTILVLSRGGERKRYVLLTHALTGAGSAVREVTNLSDCLLAELGILGSGSSTQASWFQAENNADRAGNVHRLACRRQPPTSFINTKYNDVVRFLVCGEKVMP